MIIGKIANGHILAIFYPFSQFCEIATRLTPLVLAGRRAARLGPGAGPRRPRRGRADQGFNILYIYIYIYMYVYVCIFIC